MHDAWCMMYDACRIMHDACRIMHGACRAHVCLCRYRREWELLTLFKNVQGSARCSTSTRQRCARMCMCMRLWAMHMRIGMWSGTRCWSLPRPNEAQHAGLEGEEVRVRPLCWQEKTCWLVSCLLSCCVLDICKNYLQVGDRVRRRRCRPTCRQQAYNGEL